MRLPARAKRGVRRGVVRSEVQFGVASDATTRQSVRVTSQPSLPGTSFHDAEILSCRIDRRGPTVEIDIEAFAGTERAAQYRLRFLEVAEVELQGLNQQNVIFDLTAVEDGGGWVVTIHPCYGLSGALRCRAIESSAIP